MGHQIIKQPNGKFAIWSTIIDDFISMDNTPENLIQYYIEASKKEIRERITETINTLESGGKPYYQFTMTWEEALRLRDEIHS